MANLPTALRARLVRRLLEAARAIPQGEALAARFAGPAFAVPESELRAFEETAGLRRETFEAFLDQIAGGDPPASVRTAAERAGAELFAAETRLDRDRNHFIKRFRMEHGGSGEDWPADLKAQMDRGVADFTGRKEEAFRAAADRLTAELERLIPGGG